MSTMMTLHMEDGGGPPVESSCGLGVVEPLDGGLLVASARDIGLQRLADADGRPSILNAHLASGVCLVKGRPMGVRPVSAWPGWMTSVTSGARTW